MNIQVEEKYQKGKWDFKFSTLQNFGIKGG